jgi:non-specific riboncleoside hydrolase
MKKNVILDVDTGIDDAIAIALATHTKNLNIKLITTIAGNLSVNEVTKNTLNFLQAIDKRNIPVAFGASKPMEREKDDSIQAHGKKGLGKYKFPKLELKPTKLPAVEKMHEVISKSKENIIICALGPLTNVAQLLLKYPEDMEKIEYILISGGLLHDSKRNPYLSFNIMQDPEAARYVLKSGEKIIICPSNHGHTAFLTLEEVEEMRKTNKTGEMLEYICRSYKDRHVKVGVATHDPCAVAFIAHPEYFEKQMMYVHIRFLEKQQTGVIDFDTKKAPNMMVATEINVKRFKKLFFKALNRMP